ncbi:hypothetical protein BGZ76_007179 [Entomortierella beljakovae]|nr:hypothetical protein BGZ76_007179 [Entomortierella beljakovae]
MTRLVLLVQFVAVSLFLSQSYGLPSPASISAAVEIPGPIIPAAPTISNVITEGVCRHHPGGGKCPEYAPCCLNGYCSDDPRYCSIGCEPKNSWKESSCFPKAYCSSIREDFNKPKLANIKTFNGNPNDFDFTTDYNADSVAVEDSKLKITMKLDSVLNSYGRPQGLGSVVSTTRFMQYGKVTARIKTGSSSPGVVSAFIMRNEAPGDEIDFEFVGRNPSEAQTNFYYKTPPDMPTESIDYNNTGKILLGANSALDFHDYGIEWMPEYINWSVDGKVIRSVFKNQTKDDVDPITGAPIMDEATGQPVKRFPSTPARIQFGIWDGGQGSDGTAAWAGTPTDWSKPGQSYEVQIDYVDIQCLYTGNGTEVWPPSGHGPTKTHEGPYYTPGLDNRSGSYDEDGYNDQSPAQNPYVPFYKNMTLMIPTGCLLALGILVAFTMEINKRRRLAKVRWS